MISTQGYREMFVRRGLWGGENLAPHTRMFVRLAPPEIPAAVVSFQTHDGVPSWFGSGDVHAVQATSDGRSFFGLGAAGMVAADLAARLDHQLAPWDLELNGPKGNMVLYARGGPPTQDEWARMQQRLSYLGMDDLRPEERDLMLAEAWKRPATSAAPGMQRTATPRRAPRRRS